MIKILIIVISGLILSELLLCLLIPRSRKYFFCEARSLYENLWEMLPDYTPSKKRNVSIWKFISVLFLMPLISILYFILIILAFPYVSIRRSILWPEKVDRELEWDRLKREPLPPSPTYPKRTPEQIKADNLALIEKWNATHFEVKKEDVGVELDETEIFFYTPGSDQIIEKLIDDNLPDILSVFESTNYHFFFIPEFNRAFNIEGDANRLSYFNPRFDASVPHPSVGITYSNIKQALSIPEKVDSPCFIRCQRKDRDPYLFSFFKLEIKDGDDIITIVKEYLNKVGDGRYYSLTTDDEIRKRIEGLPADERYDTDVYLIGKEIKERIDKLRAIGLTSLAIKKLIGDDSDKPGKLLIDKHNRLILTDYGNKEIKLSPLHKAVFFLFLRHPEGIYFKDLSSYKEELASIYGEITGRDNKKSIEESIEKLTDPFDTSINEKCARIKNAFVSEFREEVAQWYFIDGSKGERKSIKLPRELVTWEIKD